MQWLTDIFANRYFMAAVGSWLVAQVVKAILYAILNKRVSLERLFGDGGMPSGHSATVTALATMSGLIHGLGSFEFAVTSLLAIIVCHDAMGVRLETGKQAVLLNEIIRSFEILTEDKLPEVKLKELVGHTPIQVSAGIFIGFAMAVVMYFFF